MLERSVPYLKLVAALLGLLVLYQLVSIPMGGTPLPSTEVDVIASDGGTESNEGNEEEDQGAGRGRGRGNVPPEVEERAQELISSEVFGEKPQPRPLMLFGIAGDSVFLGTPSGQTGRVKEGEELGGVKVVRIGSNRVLVEHNGEEKELTIFKGLGGESLLSNKKE